MSATNALKQPAARWAPFSEDNGAPALALALSVMNDGAPPFDALATCFGRKAAPAPLAVQKCSPPPASTKNDYRPTRRFTPIDERHQGLAIVSFSPLAGPERNPEGEKKREGRVTGPACAPSFGACCVRQVLADGDGVRTRDPQIRSLVL